MTKESPNRESSHRDFLKPPQVDPFPHCSQSQVPKNSALSFLEYEEAPTQLRARTLYILYRVFMRTTLQKCNIPVLKTTEKCEERETWQHGSRYSSGLRVAITTWK
ncbi:unnamed protein product [Ixodes hexagonus]